MKNFKKNKYLVAIFIVALLLFYPAFSTFFTNDDFFHLYISRAQSIKDFLNFFNLLSPVSGFPNYRPISIQVYYFLGRAISGLNPIAYRLISFATFFFVIYLIYLFVKKITKSGKISLISAFLYATSATHFAHLYYSGAFQELSLALFFLISCLYFWKFLEKRNFKNYTISLAAFILALMSKETALVLPFCLILLYLYRKYTGGKIVEIKKLVIYMLPFLALLVGYSYLRIFHYGFASGDSYIWDFSIRRAVNTLGWYGLWSFNLPEMLVDFVGPGLKFNPNLFRFWSTQIIPIFILFGVFLSEILYLIFKNARKLFLNHKSLILILFCIAWFITTLIPVLFLPLHKFTFYLTLPLIGVVTLIGYLTFNLKSRIINLLLITTWLVLSILTLSLTRDTHWIVSGGRTAKSVYTYFNKNYSALKGYKNIVLYDTPEDKSLPWMPTVVLKAVLSDNNFFKVFYADKYQAWYSKESYSGRDAYYISARQFLGY